MAVWALELTRLGFQQKPAVVRVLASSRHCSLAVKKKKKTGNLSAWCGINSSLWKREFDLCIPPLPALLFFDLNFLRGKPPESSFSKALDVPYGPSLQSQTLRRTGLPRGQRGSIYLLEIALDSCLVPNISIVGRNNNNNN